MHLKNLLEILLGCVEMNRTNREKSIEALSTMGRNETTMGTTTDVSTTVIITWWPQKKKKINVHCVQYTVWAPKIRPLHLTHRRSKYFTTIYQKILMGINLRIHSSAVRVTSESHDYHQLFVPKSHEKILNFILNEKAYIKAKLRLS